jgi:hypothetical protein
MAHGSQDGGSGGLADPGQLHQAVVGRALGKQRDGLGEPQWLFGQRLDQVVDQCSDRERVEALGGMETEAGGGQGIDTVAGLWAPRPATLAGLPRCQKACAAVAQDRLWSRMGVQAAQSGRWRQGLHQGIECRQGEVQGGAQLLAEWADPFFQRHSPLPQTIGSLQCRGAFDGQQKLPLP